MTRGMNFEDTKNEIAVEDNEGRIEELFEETFQRHHSTSGDIYLFDIMTYCSRYSQTAPLAHAWSIIVRI